jgi:hypothetical protein
MPHARGPRVQCGIAAPGAPRCRAADTARAARDPAAEPGKDRLLDRLATFRTRRRQSRGPTHKPRLRRSACLPRQPAPEGRSRVRGSEALGRGYRSTPPTSQRRVCGTTNRIAPRSALPRTGLVHGASGSRSLAPEANRTCSPYRFRCEESGWRRDTSTGCPVQTGTRRLVRLPIAQPDGSRLSCRTDDRLAGTTWFRRPMVPRSMAASGGPAVAPASPDPGRSSR